MGSVDEAKRLIFSAFECLDGASPGELGQGLDVGRCNLGRLHDKVGPCLTC